MEIIYDKIGKSYDTTRKADPEIARRLKGHLQVSKGQILDVACGTGNYTFALKNLGLNIRGMDISNEMLGKARDKSDEVDWDLADITSLPYSHRMFYGATCILAIHHFGDLLAPFREVYRVMASGRLVIFTSSPEQIRKYWLTHYSPRAIEDSARQMPEISTVARALRGAGFSNVGIETFLVQPDLQDFFLYSGKYEPALYLDEQVRSGISTFANLASPDEIEEGCLKLKRDIDEKRYDSDLGDYVFVVAEKN